MSRPPRIGDIEIDEDMAFQRRLWLGQRIGWGIMAVLVIGGLLGAFGGRGPLARTTAGAPTDPLRVEYSRLARHRALDEIRIELGAGQASRADSTAAIWFARDWLQGMSVREVNPEPVETGIEGDRVVYRFKLSDPSAAASLRLEVEPLASFVRRGTLGLVGGVSHDLTQFVFP